MNKLNQNNNYNNKNTKIKQYYSTINITHTIQKTNNINKLIPIYYKKLIPKKKTSINTKTTLQFIPFINNLLHKINNKITYNFTPNQLI